MAKKSSKALKESQAQLKKAAGKEEEISLKNISDVESRSELYSDVQGLVEAQRSKKASHTVKLTKEDQAEESANVSAKKRAVIYVGRLPKLFQERELKKYFSQFGDIIRLRVSRNKVTGASRNYSFVEFKDLQAAQIAAETMNNYLLVGHLLRVHVIDNPQDNLFSKKMKSDFREFDWRAKAYEQHSAPKPLETWKELQKKYEDSKREKFEELQKLGFNYALEA